MGEMQNEIQDQWWTLNVELFNVFIVCLLHFSINIRLCVGVESLRVDLSSFTTATKADGLSRGRVVKMFNTIYIRSYFVVSTKLMIREWLSREIEKERKFPSIEAEKKKKEKK